MIRVTEMTRDRLVLTNAPNLWVTCAVVGFFLIATIIVWGLSGTLGGFGFFFAILWTALFILIFGRVAWVNAIFDAKTKTLETKFCRLVWMPRRMRHDIGQLDKVTWDHVALWSELIKPGQDIAQARSHLVIRRETSKRALTALEQAALGEPVLLEGLPEKLPEERAGEVIRSWLAQARKN